MGLFADLAARTFGATYQPWDDYWFRKDPRESTSSAMVSTSPDSSMRLAAVYACVRILADLVGYVPMLVYKRRADGGKDRAPDHPLYPLLHLRPNTWQTAIRWRQLGQRHVLLRGNFYCQIIASTRRIVELRPFPEPNLMKVALLGNGRRGYVYRWPGRGEVPYTQDDIFHVMGMSLDGISGVSVIDYARESVGRSLAEDLYAARFYGGGTGLKGALVTPGKLSKEAREANQQSWQEANAGWWNSHKVALLEGGLDWKQIGVTARDAQFIEGRQFSVADIARWFGVPPHMIGDVDRSTSWGTGIEQQSIGFLQTTMMPWFATWEQEADRALLWDDEEYFAEFLVDAMLRADTAARSEAQRRYVDGGILAVNEVRLQENHNPIVGDEYEKPHRAGNITGGSPEFTRRPPASAPPTEPGQSPGRRPPTDTRAQTVVARAATSLVRREIAAIQRWAPRYAGNVEGWREWVCDFYGKHTARLEEDLGLDQATARRYSAEHTARLLAEGIAVLEEWDRHAPAGLAALALGEEEVDHADSATA